MFVQRSNYRRSAPESTDGLINLSYNENPLGPSPRGIGRASKALAFAHQYPNVSSPNAARAIADKLGVNPRCVVVGNGVTQLCGLVGAEFLGGTKRAVVSQASFFVYHFASHYLGTGAISIPLLESFDQDVYGLIAAAQDDVGVVFVTSPNNPTGLEVEDSDLLAMADALPEHVLLVIDQAYVDFSETSPDGGSLLLRAAQERDNLLVLRSFSKSYGLAGLRLGFGVSSRETIDRLETAQISLDAGNVGLVAEQAAIGALEDDEFLLQTKDYVSDVKRSARETLTQAGHRVLPSQTNFLFTEVGCCESAVCERLERLGFLVTAGEVLGFPGWIRFGVSRSSTMTRFVECLIESLAAGGRNQ